MKTILKNLSVVTITIASLSAGMLAPAFSATQTLIKVRNDGFRACQELGNSGYTGVVRGTLSYGGGFALDRGHSKFSIRYCFDRKRDCTRFVGRIENIIRGVDTVRYRVCSTRG